MTAESRDCVRACGHVEPVPVRVVDGLSELLRCAACETTDRWCGPLAAFDFESSGDLAAECREMVP